MAKKIPCLECFKCEEDIPLLPENAILAVFTSEPHLNYLLVQCVDCDIWNRNFIDSENLEMLQGFGIPVIEEERATDEVVESYCEVRNILQPRSLTPSEEHQVEFFRWILEAGAQS